MAKGEISCTEMKCECWCGGFEKKRSYDVYLTLQDGFVPGKDVNAHF